MNRPLRDPEAGPFFHAWESLPTPEREIETRKRLRELLDFSRKFSPFYGRRLADFSIHTDDEHPLLAVPVLEASDLRDAIPPASHALLTDPNASYTVFQSGGTTGVPKTSLFTYAEMELINDCNARGFFGVGLTPQDRVANLWAVGGLYMTFVHMNRVLMEYGCMNFPFSNQTPVDFVQTVAKLFQINCFSGITSVVLNCLREIHRKEPGSLKIDKIFFGGEHIYEADRQEMRDKLGIQTIRAPAYGTVDSWYLGYQCDQCANGVFHAFDDMVYLEIFDEDSRLPSPTGKPGMLYATVFPRRLTPIIRLRVGDRARWLGDGCPCGRQTPRFELLGRGDDVLRIGYDSIDYASVQAILSRVHGLGGRMQMEKRRLEGKDELIIRLESDLAPARKTELELEFKVLFLEERPSFREFSKKGIVLPLRVEWVAEGELPQNKRTGKLIRIIDSL